MRAVNVSQSKKMTHLRYWLNLIGLLCWQKHDCLGDGALNLGRISTKTFTDPAPKTAQKEVICINAFQKDIVDQTQMLIGLCRSDLTNQDISGAIGNVPVIDFLEPQRSISTVNERYGNTAASAPVNGTNWDGVGTNAKILHPEEFVQVRDILYFVDVKSCLRKINRTTNEVTTLLGSCGRTTLNLDGVPPSRVHGMCYFEEHNMFVFMVANKGVYKCISSSTGTFSCRIVVEKENFHSQIPGIKGRQLIRGVDQDGRPNQDVWHKVSYGINRYNFSRVIGNNDGKVDYSNFGLWNYLSARTFEEVEVSTRHRVDDDDIGAGDAVFVFSNQGPVLLVFDIETEVWLAIDTYSFRSPQRLCQKSSSYPRLNEIDRCTFSDISAATWLPEKNTILIAERNPGEIRIGITCPSQCNIAGTLTENCTISSQTCSCIPSVMGSDCSQCVDGSWNFPFCDECGCSASGSVDMICDKLTGQCACKFGYTGQQCTECDDGHYGYPSCAPCNCNNEGSNNTMCDMSTGACDCLEYISGRQCDTCANNSYTFPDCEPYTISQLSCHFVLWQDCPIASVNFTGFSEWWKQIFILPFDGLSNADSLSWLASGGKMLAKWNRTGEKGGFILGPLESGMTVKVEFMYCISSERPASTLNLSWIDAGGTDHISSATRNVIWSSNGAAPTGWISAEATFDSSDKFYLIWTVIKNVASNVKGSDVAVDDIVVNPVKFRSNNQIAPSMTSNVDCYFYSPIECEEILQIYDWQPYDWIWKFYEPDTSTPSLSDPMEDADDSGGFLYLSGEKNANIGAFSLGPIHSVFGKFRMTFHYYCQNAETVRMKVIMLSGQPETGSKRTYSTTVLWSFSKSTSDWKMFSTSFQQQGPFQVIFMVSKVTPSEVIGNIAIDAITIEEDLPTTTASSSGKELKFSFRLGLILGLYFNLL